MNEEEEEVTLECKTIPNIAAVLYNFSGSHQRKA